MLSALHVAADVTRSNSKQQSPQLSASGTRKAFRTRRRARTAESERSPQAPSPGPQTWLPTQRGPHPQYAVPSSPLQPNTTIRMQQSTFSLRDQAVEKFEAGLQMQGSLSPTGKMTPPVHVQNISSKARALALQSGVEKRGQPSNTITPTTPAFFPSPTSPTTPIIPPTPPMSQEHWSQPSSSKYPHTGYTGERNIYSPQPYLRQRSVTTSSIPPTSPVKLSPVALPIGKKLPKWREAYEEVTPSQVYATTSYTFTSCPRPFTSRSYDSSPSRFNRVNAPMGPRPRGSQAYSTGLGIAMSRSTDYNDYAPSAYLQRGALRRQYSRTDSDWLGTERSFPGPDGYDAYSRGDEISLAGRSRRGASDESDGVAGSMWEGRGYESGCEEDGGEEAELRSSSDEERSPRRPFIVPPPWPDSRPETADPEASPLDEPFELRQSHSVESGERSAFDSDTEDEEEMDEGRPLRRGFTQLRKTIKTSMSVPSIKARLSVFSTTGSSSLDTSPDSVASLRARQMTNSSTPGRNPFILKLATDIALDPIPPSPADDVESPEFPPAADADLARSPETPVTPVSPVMRQTKSFIWEVSKAPLFLTTPPPPLPNSHLHHSGGPPNLPLPATPMSMSTPSLPLRPTLSHSGRGGSFVEKWRMDVGSDRLTMVDPNTSMARLEESLAKLESHAPPRLSGESELTGEPSRVQTFHETRPSVDSVSVYSTPFTGEGEPSGVVVLSVEPTPSASQGTIPPPPPPKLAPSSSPPSPPVTPLAPRRLARTGRQPSIPMLPLFDFGGELDLELHVPPLRSSSLISPRPSAESTPHTRASSADDAPSPQPPMTPMAPLEPVRYRPPSDEPEPASFMHVSPPPPQTQKTGSRMRRLLQWSRVDPRGGVGKGGR